MSALCEPRHLLVIEDELALRELLRLELKPHLLTMAAHQEAAYAELEARRFDLVLLDLRLPVSERDLEPHSDVGFDILRSIRQQYPKDRLPVVVMTAFEGTSETTVRAFLYGANDYWSKDGRHSRTLPEVVAGNLRTQAECRQQIVDEIASRGHRLDFCANRSRVVIDGKITFTKKRCALLALLRENHVTAVESGQEPPFVPLSKLARRLRSNQDYTRRLVMDIRQAIVSSYADSYGVKLENNTVIENVLGTGYRLNPVTVHLADLA